MAKKHKDIQKTLDSVIDKMESGKLDNVSALAVAKVISVKISGYKEQLKYKKATGSPDKIEFFED
tara:strand:+ start:98 stop:292 length:195 start_codon:yes stop_codon:yes gene_type:complete